MLEITILVLGAAVLIRLAPGLPMARFCNDWLAVRPARWLLRRTRQEVLAWAIVGALFAVAGEYVLVLGGPQAALGLAVDLAIYADASIAAVTLASAARVQGLKQWMQRAISRLPTRPRAARGRRIARPRPSANDDDGDPVRLAA